MSSRMLVGILLCAVFLVAGSLYYYSCNTKLSTLSAEGSSYQIARDNEVIERIEKDIILAIKNDITSGENVDLPIKNQIEKVVKDTIINSPEIIIDSITKYNQKKRDEMYQESTDKVKELLSSLENAGNNPVYGAKNPTIRVVEFFDYSCGYCKKMFEINKRIAAKHQDVQFIYREFPMYPASTEATRAALAVNIIDPQKYIPFQEKMFTFDGEKTRQNIEDIAVGMDISKELFRKTLESAIIQKTWQENINFMKKMNLRGTPVLIIGGELVPGFIEFDEFDKLIQKLKDKKSSARNSAEQETKNDNEKSSS